MEIGTRWNKIIRNRITNSRNNIYNWKSIRLLEWPKLGEFWKDNTRNRSCDTWTWFIDRKCTTNCSRSNNTNSWNNHKILGTNKSIFTKRNRLVGRTERLGTSTFWRRIRRYLWYVCAFNTKCVKSIWWFI